MRAQRVKSASRTRTSKTETRGLFTEPPQLEARGLTEKDNTNLDKSCLPSPHRERQEVETDTDKETKSDTEYRPSAWPLNTETAAPPER